MKFEIGKKYLIGKSKEPVMLHDKVEIGDDLGICTFLDETDGQFYQLTFKTLNKVGFQKYEALGKEEFRLVVGQKYRHPDLNFNLTLKCKISDIVSLFETDKENISVTIGAEDYQKLTPVKSESKVIELRNEKAWFGAEETLKKYILDSEFFLPKITKKNCSDLRWKKEEVPDIWNKKYRLEIDSGRIVEEE